MRPHRELEEPTSCWGEEEIRTQGHLTARQERETGWSVLCTVLVKDTSFKSSLYEYVSSVACDSDMEMSEEIKETNSGSEHTVLVKTHIYMCMSIIYLIIHYSLTSEQIKESGKPLSTIWHSMTSQSVISAAIWHCDIIVPHLCRYGTVV